MDDKCGQPYGILFAVSVMLGAYLAHIWIWT